MIQSYGDAGSAVRGDTMAVMREDPPTPFIVVDDGDEENRDSDAEPRLDRPAGLRLRREAMQRDGLRRARSWSYVGAIVLFAGSLQLAVSILRIRPNSDGLSILLPGALFILMLFGSIRLLRRGRRLTREVKTRT